MKKSLIGLSVIASFVLADGSYNLGKINVQASDVTNINMIEQSVTSKYIAQNNERNIAQSLDNMSGLSMNYAGARGESKVSIRGHNAQRISVFIDGIPVYVPYDGNFDFGRFLTNDIAQIDVSKGYSSVAYGANTMGGVVNLITKKPTKEFKGDIRGEIIFDSNGKKAKHIESIHLGSRIGNFYTQLSGTYTKRDHFRLSDDYTATASSEQPKGERLYSENKDHKISFKAGYLVDDGSEIAISYANQKGEKEYPVSVNKKEAREQFRTSPFWNKETVSISGVNFLGNGYIKVLAYYDKSNNSMSAYDDNTFSTQNKKFAFSSEYDDYTYGTRLEYGLETDENFFKVATNYKKDVHRDYNLKENGKLDKKYKGNTLSIGVENIYNLTKDLQLLAGMSYDRLKDDSAFDSNPKATPKLSKMDAFSPQIALIHTLDINSKVKASFSNKTYFPSMKDRFSGRIGKYKPNPNLSEEKANHYELGYAYKKQSLLININVYFSKIKDAINQKKVADPDSFGETLDQNQNIGKFEHKGLELDLAYNIDQTNTTIGGNYAYVEVKNKTNNDNKRTYVPKQQVFTYVKQDFSSGFSIYANMKIRSGVYAEDNDKNNDDYLEVPSFTTFDLKTMYEYSDQLLFEVGVKNFTDKNTQYDLGFPEAGREYFVAMSYKF